MARVRKLQHLLRQKAHGLGLLTHKCADCSLIKDIVSKVSQDRNLSSQRIPNISNFLATQGIVSQVKQFSA